MRRALVCGADGFIGGHLVLVHSDLEGPTNIGTEQYVMVDEAAALTADGDRRLWEGDSRSACGGSGGCAGKEL